MTQKARLNALEKQHRTSKGKAGQFVFISQLDDHPTEITYNGQQISQADLDELDRKLGDSLTKIYIVNSDGEKVTSIGAKSWATVSPLDWDEPKAAE